LGFFPATIYRFQRLLFGFFPGSKAGFLGLYLIFAEQQITSRDFSMMASSNQPGAQTYTIDFTGTIKP